MNLLFLPRDATLARYMPRYCVRPSVRLSQDIVLSKWPNTGLYTNNAHNSAVTSFLYQRSGWNPDGITPSWAFKCRWGSKNCDFRQIKQYISKMVKDRDYSCNETLIWKVNRKSCIEPWQLPFLPMTLRDHNHVPLSLYFYFVILYIYWTIIRDSVQILYICRPQLVIIALGW